MPRPTRPRVPLTLSISVVDALCFRRTGIMPSGAVDALARAIDRLGPLEWLVIEEDARQFHAAEREWDAALKGKAPG